MGLLYNIEEYLRREKYYIARTFFLEPGVIKKRNLEGCLPESVDKSKPNKIDEEKKDCYD